MSSEGSALTSGTLLGHYRIEGPLGAGGMGEVYRAKDMRLGRDVAVKILPRVFSREPERVARFEREARVLASLNHPNLLAVHDVGVEGDIRYTVTELLEGRTLRETLDGGPIGVSEVSRLGLQLCRGLAAAHARGIVHRDLKPENVFVGTEGHLKILDFGLATPPPSGPDASAEDTSPLAARTSPGTVMGTYRYMAPEQLRGEPVDQRTDIFALGLLLYEMLTGRHAFHRPAPAEEVAAILKDAAKDPRSLAPSTPAPLASLVLRCLQKRTEDRPGAVQDLMEPLRAAAAPPRESERRLGRTAALAAGALAASALAAGGLWLLFGRSPSGGIPAFRPRQVTAGVAVESGLALSPDGRSVAYAVQGDGGSDLWVSDVQGGHALRITTDGASNDDPAWFPDGSALAFASARGGTQGIWKVSRFGGAPVPILGDAEDPAISPDGSRIAFVRRANDGFTRVGVAFLDEPRSARLLTSGRDGVWDHRHPAWSPDGLTLCYADQNDLWLVPAEGGTARPLTRDDPPDQGPVWSPDGRRILFTSLREGTLALWRVDVDSGRLERITMGTGPEQSPSLSADGKRLAYVTSGERRSVVLVDLDSGRRTALRPGRETYEPDLAPDGSSVVFTSNREGRFDLWKVPLRDGLPAGEPLRLTESAGSCAHPTFSPDGRWIAFHEVVNGRRDVWILSAAGGTPLRITNTEAADVLPEWAPEGARLGFLSDRGGANQVWAVPMRQGKPSGPAQALTKLPDPVVSFAWAPDGASLACVVAAPGGEDLWLCPLRAGSQPRRLTQGAGARFVVWDAPRKRLLVTGTWGGALAGIRAVSPADGVATPVPQALPSEPGAEPMDCSVSADGRLLVFYESAAGGDVWVLESQAGAF